MKDIKIKDAAFFPKPPVFYKELPTARALGAEAAEYMGAWVFNCLHLFYSAANPLPEFSGNGFI